MSDDGGDDDDDDDDDDGNDSLATNYIDSYVGDNTFAFTASVRNTLRMQTTSVRDNMLIIDMFH